MPIYTYRCENCGIQFERNQKFSDPPLKICPECHKKALRKVYTPVGIVFKGSGFYVTDHRSTSSTTRPYNKSNEGGSSNESKEKSPGSADTKTDAGDASKSTSSETQ
jgi:putative FmdB family regulatory protein